MTMKVLNNYFAQTDVPKAMKIVEVQEASEKDKTVCKIREYIEKNNWTKEGELKPYFIVCKDLTFMSLLY